ncbi:hypothetical protein [Arthrobacter sp. UYCo732]|uniref:hypothetical protein n=1 Tax=Arthrobacter sp. UYCo732 TaxID=3156336 RepID=UPI0033956B15
MGCQFLHGELFSEVLPGPGAGVGEEDQGCGHRTFHELDLAPFPVWRHHHPPRNAVGRLGSIVLADQVHRSMPAATPALVLTLPSSMYRTPASTATAG